MVSAKQRVLKQVLAYYQPVLRGEAVVAPAGAVLAAILLAAVAMNSWWALRTQRQALQEARSEQVRAVGDLLVQSVETLLLTDDVSGVRRIVIEAARLQRLSQCRVVLPDGQVVADAEPARITVHELPRQWQTREDEAITEVTEEGQLHLIYGLSVPGRGSGTLEIVADSMTLWSTWHVRAGMGAVGASGLLAMLLVYRWIRVRVRTMAVIRDALLASGAGPSAAGQLQISEERFGPEARLWNQLLAERHRLAEQSLGEKVAAALGAGQSQGAIELETACDALAQGLVVVDGQLRVRYANGAAAVFLQVPRNELLNAELPSRVKEPKVVEALRGAVGEPGRRSTIETEPAPEAGTDGHGSVLRYAVRPLRLKDAKAAALIIEDITQQRVAQDSRNSFVNQATHELRTPLTNIRLYVESALEEGEKNPKVVGESLNVINQEVRRLEKLVGEMLSVAEIESGSMHVKRDDVPVEALVKELQADYQAQAAEKGLTLEFQLAPKLPVLRADKAKLAQALHNLLGNALKYTPAGGKVTVTAEADAKNVTLQVADTGIGIGAEDREKVFEKFYRAKDKRVASITGTGLGLALAREIVRLHGGDITVESELDKGSRFTVTLPVTAGS